MTNLSGTADTQSLATKLRNLSIHEQRERERTCFWTWPLGHIPTAYMSDPVEITGEHVRIFVSICKACGHERRYAIDVYGHARGELSSRVLKVKIALPS